MVAHSFNFALFSQIIVGFNPKFGVLEQNFSTNIRQPNV